MINYLNKTTMLNYDAEEIVTLINDRGWKNLDDFHKILEIYIFIRDEIKFGYNINDNITATQVLKDGYGQCNTKGTLFMALLRAVDIRCRTHGFTIDKKLQKGAMSGFVYRLAPQNVLHSWVEVYYENIWYDLEGFIIDKAYLTKLQDKFNGCKGSFCGYGVAVTDFKNPIIDWNVNSTYIQKEGINQDFGVFNSPDEFFLEHSQELKPLKEFIYVHVGRHLMNKNVNNIRKRRILV